MDPLADRVFLVWSQPQAGSEPRLRPIRGEQGEYLVQGEAMRVGRWLLKGGESGIVTA